MKLLPTSTLVALSTTMMFAMISVSAAQTEALRDDNPNNWPLYNRTFDGTRYSPLKEISKENMATISFSLPPFTSHF